MTLYFFPYSVKTSKCSGSWNSINNSLAKLCVPDIVKKLNVKAFNIVSGTNKQSTQNGMKRVSVNVDSNIVFVIISNIGMMINAGVNAKD